jgi:hypothetical protein
MRKLITLALVGVLSLCLVGPSTAKKPKKPRKPATPVVVPVDQKFYLRRDACASDADNTRLSLQDGPDGACSWDDGGLAHDVYRESGLIDPTTVFAAENGTPLTLDASKHVTGEITLYHAATCVVAGACSPVPLNVGQAHFTARVIVTVAGEDKEIGVVDEEFTTTPGAPYTVKIDLAIDPALNGATVEGLRLETFHGGQAIGPGGISYDDPASYVTIPALVTQTP